MEFKGKSCCSICLHQLGLLWNRGTPCSFCASKICKNCRIVTDTPSHKYICKVCEMKWIIDMRTRKYGLFFGPLPLIPSTHVGTITRSNKTKYVGHTHGSVLFKKCLLKSLIEESNAKFLRSKHPQKCSRASCSKKITRSCMQEGIGYIHRQEMIQNADDACAIHFFVDHWHHGQTTMVTPSLGHFQWPCLVSANDAVFSEEDWDGIQNLQQSIKADDPFKFGRFGILNSVDHLTDVPSTVNSDKMVYLDTQTKLWDAGRLFKLSVIQCKDNVSSFHGIADFHSRNISYCPKNLLHFPLRTTSSNLSENVYTLEKSLRLTNALKAEAKLLLIFLHSVTSIEVHEINSNGVKTLLFHTKVTDKFMPDLTQKRSSLMHKVRDSHKQHQYNFSAVHTFIVRFDVSTYERSTRTTTHRLVENQVGSSIPKVRETTVKQKFFTWLETALELDSCRDSRFFCFLPMPIEATSNLLIHINCMFSLNDDQLSLKLPVERRNDSMANWNHRLVNELVPSCNISLLLEAKKVIGGDNFYKAWPVVKNLKSTHWEGLLQPLFDKLLKSDALWSEAIRQPGDWVVPTVAVYIPQSINKLKTVVGKTLTSCVVKLAKVQDCIRNTFSFARVEVNEVSPEFVRDSLRAIISSYRNAEFNGKLDLLKYCLSDSNYGYLDQLELLPLDNGSFLSFQRLHSGASQVYLCTSNCPRSVFPNLDHKLVDLSSDADLNKCLSHVVNSNHSQLRVLNSNQYANLIDEAAMPVQWRNLTIVNFPCKDKFPKEWFKIFLEWFSNKNLGLFSNKLIAPVQKTNLTAANQFSVIRLALSQAVLYIPHYQTLAYEMTSLLTKYGVMCSPQNLFSYLSHPGLESYILSYNSNNIIEVTCKHWHISPSLVKYLKVTPHSEELDVSEDTFTDSGQYELIPLRLKNILKDYKDGGSIVKELIQNADDAGSTDHICFDTCSQKFEQRSLFFPGMHESHGPALVVHNNSTFSNEDFDNIHKLVAATKKEKHLKIGIVFCSVYHITDVPSFTSQIRMNIFDPTLKHLRKEVKNSTQPGKMLKYLSKDVEKSCQLSPHEGHFDFSSSTDFQGIMFCLPFRSAPCELSSTYYTGPHVKELFDGIRECSDKLLLFLRHVKKITLQQIEVGQNHPTLLYALSKFIPTAILHLDQAYLTSKVSVQTRDLMATTCTDWLVANTSISSWCTTPGHGAIPPRRQNKSAEASVTGFLLNRNSERSDDYTLDCDHNGEVFCYLPLCQTTGLPVHVSCNFAVINNHRGIWTPADILSHSDTVQWNMHIMNVIPTAYIRLLCSLKDMRKSGFLQNYQFHYLWPLDAKLQMKNPWQEFVTLRYNNLTREELFYSESTAWLKKENIKFLEDEILFNSVVLPCVFDVVNHLKFPLLQLPSSHRLLVNETLNEEDLVFSSLSFLSDQDIACKSNEVILCMLEAYTNRKHSSSPLFFQLKLCFETYAFIPCHPNGSVLNKCSDLVHPEAHFSELVDETENNFPINLHVSSTAAEVMNEEGMMHDPLPWNLVLARAHTISNLLQTNSLKALERRVRFILKALTNHVSGEAPATRAIDLVPFLPVLKKPEIYPLGWYGESHQLLCERELILSCVRANPHIGNTLIAGSLVSFTCKSTPYEGDCNEDVRELLHLRLSPTCSEVIEHLKESVDQQSDSIDKEWVTKSFRMTYEFLNSALESGDPEVDLNQMKVISCIWNENEFLSIDLVETDQRLKNGPYLYSVPDIVDKKELIKALDINSFTDAQKSLEMLKNDFCNEPVSNEFLELVKDLIRMFSQPLDSHKELNQQLGQFALYLLAEHLVLRKSSDLDAGRPPRNKEYNYVHNDIPRDLSAEALGVRLMLSKMVDQYISDNFWGEIEFGQHEDLTSRIQNILRYYALDVTILEELLQNSDNARAKKMYFILDMRTHGNESLISENWQKFQGSDLLVWNGCTFSEDDLKSIQELGLGSKRSEGETFGQYGIGFNAVYHVTSFMTLCIFNPHCMYADRATKLSPGRRYDKLSEEFWKNFSDMSLSLDNISRELRSVSLFRFPIRHSLELMKSSMILDEDDYKSSQPLTAVAMSTNLKEWMPKMKSAMLFLNNVTEIRYMEIEPKSTTLKTVYLFQSRIPEPSNFELHNSISFNEVVNCQTYSRILTINKTKSLTFLLKNSEIDILICYFASNLTLSGSLNSLQSLPFFEDIAGNYQAIKGKTVYVRPMSCSAGCQTWLAEQNSVFIKPHASWTHLGSAMLLSVQSISAGELYNEFISFGKMSEKERYEHLEYIRDVLFPRMHLTESVSEREWNVKYAAKIFYESLLTLKCIGTDNSVLLPICSFCDHTQEIFNVFSKYFQILSKTLQSPEWLSFFKELNLKQNLTETEYLQFFQKTADVSLDSIRICLMVFLEYLFSMKVQQMWCENTRFLSKVSSIPLVFTEKAAAVDWVLPGAVQANQLVKLNGSASIHLQHLVRTVRPIMQPPEKVNKKLNFLGGVVVQPSISDVASNIRKISKSSYAEHQLITNFSKDMVPPDVVSNLMVLLEKNFKFLYEYFDKSLFLKLSSHPFIPIYVNICRKDKKQVVLVHPNCVLNSTKGCRQFHPLLLELPPPTELFPLSCALKEIGIQSKIGLHHMQTVLEKVFKSSESLSLDSNTKESVKLTITKLKVLLTHEEKPDDVVNFLTLLYLPNTHDNLKLSTSLFYKDTASYFCHRVYLTGSPYSYIDMEKDYGSDAQNFCRLLPLQVWPKGMALWLENLFQDQYNPENLVKIINMFVENLYQDDLLKLHIEKLLSHIFIITICDLKAQIILTENNNTIGHVKSEYLFLCDESESCLYLDYEADRDYNIGFQLAELIRTIVSQYMDVRKYKIYVKKDDELGREVSILDINKFLVGHKKYKVCIQDDSRALVPRDDRYEVLNLTAFLQSTLIEEKSDQLNKEIWKLIPVLKRRALKRLYLKHHPDKNLYNPDEFALFLQTQIAHLDQGEPQDDPGQFSNISKEQAHSSQTHSRRFDYDNWNATARKHHRGENTTEERYAAAHGNPFSSFKNDIDRPNAAEGRRWVRQAEIDLEILQSFLNQATSNHVYAHVCFLAHQVVEKALKGGVYALCGWDGSNHVDHNLSRNVLALQMVKPAEAFSLLQHSSPLESYYLNTRYPDQWEGYTDVPSDHYKQEDAGRAQVHAEEVLRIVKSIMP